MTNEQIRRAYEKATAGRPLPPEGLDQARRFIAAIFDELTPAGYIDSDGSFAEEEWAVGADCEELFRRPE